MLKFYVNLIAFTPGPKKLLQSLPVCVNKHVRNLNITSAALKEIRLKNTTIQIKKVAVDEGILGTDTVDIESFTAQESLYPDENTPHKLFNGVPYKDLPITNIKSTKNNTIMTLTSAAGKVLALYSCGCEGFKNAKKGTNIAAQQSAITFSTRIIKMGVNTVRVRVQGLGPGRMSAIKGLQMGGLNIVSITDNTKVTPNPLRPPKARKL